MDILSEFKEANLGDKRLNKRLDAIAQAFESEHGQSISFSCGDWKSVKGAYRFFDNDRFDEADIIEPHINQTFKRIHAIKNQKTLILHDSSEIILPGNKVIEGAGQMGFFKHKHSKDEWATQGMMFHSSLALSQIGVPLGVSAQQLWTRDIKNRRKIRNQKKNFTRVPVEEKESYKWLKGVSLSCKKANSPENLVHVCDRDADMHELFDHCNNLKTNFLVRAVHQRRTSKDGVKIYDRISKTPSCGGYTLNLPKTHKREARKAKVKVRYYKVRVLPPVGKKKRCAPIDLYVISVKEHGNVKDKVDWKLLTNMTVESFEQALEKIKWYKQRWNIEVFFKTLKSGFGVEKSRLRHIERLKKFVAFASVMSWKVFWLSKISREAPEAKSDHCFTKEQKKMLVKLEKSAKGFKLRMNSKSGDFIVALAKLGGYLARKSDPPPGQIVLWRGLMRLNILCAAPFMICG